jgi:hypothetical protein
MKSTWARVCSLTPCEIRNLGLIVALVTARAPRPAQAQGDSSKASLTHLFQKSERLPAAPAHGTSPITTCDDAKGWGISYGTASKKDGFKIPFSMGRIAADLETAGGTQFADMHSAPDHERRRA